MKAKVRIFRWDPEAGTKPAYRDYQVPYLPKAKVLESLIYIHKKVDPSLSFRFNCRGRHCGECAITINGTPGLSCEVPMSRELVLEPLKNLPLVKDLVIWRAKVYERMADSLPFIKPEDGKMTGIIPIAMDVLDEVIALGGCIHCLCCMSVCPALKKDNERFIGPLGLLTVAAGLENITNFNILEQTGHCKECGLCEQACPKKIPILGEAIKKLKMM